MAFTICSIVPIVFAYLFSIVTERNTNQLRLWLKMLLTQGQPAPLARPR